MIVILWTREVWSVCVAHTEAREARRWLWCARSCGVAPWRRLDVFGHSGCHLPFMVKWRKGPVWVEVVVAVAVEAAAAAVTLVE